MVLYHASNAGCYIKCILHKCIYHPNDKAIFVGYKWLINRYGKNKYFEEYLLYNPLLGPSGSMNDSSSEQVLQKINELFSNLFSEYKLKIEDCTDIYIGSYYAEFAMYVNIKKLKHSIFEEGIGDWHPLIWPHFDTFNKCASVCDMTTLNNDNVIKRYGVISKWPKEYRSNKDINYEAYNEIYKLATEDKDYLINYLKIPLDLEFEENNLLLLTQGFKINGKTWRDDSVFNMYITLLELYIPKRIKYKIFIKPHPADPIMEKYNNLRNVTVIPSRIMSELLGLIPGIHFEKVITISSTSFDTIDKFSKNKISIGYNFVSLYKLCFKYYFAVSILPEFLNINDIYRYGLINEDNIILSKMRECHNVPWGNINDENIKNSIILCNKLSWGQNNKPKYESRYANSNMLLFLDIKELLLNLDCDIDDVLKNLNVFKFLTTSNDEVKEVSYLYCLTNNIKYLHDINKLYYCYDFSYIDKKIIVTALGDTELEEEKSKVQLLYHELGY